MLTVIFRMDGRQRLSSIFAEGHAGWADSGADIVCAAASAILQATRLGLEEVARIPLQVLQQSGTLTLRWQEAARDDTTLLAIVRTAQLSLARIASQYPEHVAVRSEHET